MRYKGYWSFAPVREMTTHTVEAPDIFTAYRLLTAWGSAHKDVVDYPFDFEVQCLDGYCISCTMTSAYDTNGYNAINHLLTKHLGMDVGFEHGSDNIFVVHYYNERYEDMFSEGMAHYIRDTLLDSDTAYLFDTITIERMDDNE